MNILIVDDERLVRLSLQSTIEEIYGDENHVFQAGSARAMYALLERRTFDLVFLDINMPKQQGLDAMKQVKERYKETDWCILTGYSYFEYALKALQMGAKGYLLKPLDSDELKEFIDNIKYEHKERQKKEHSYFAEAVRKGIYLDDFSELECTEEQCYFYVFLVDVKEEENRKNIYQNLYKDLEEFLNSRLDMSASEFAIFTWTTGEICLLLPGEERIKMNSFLKFHFMEYTEEAFIVGYSIKLNCVQELKTTLSFMLTLAPLRLYLKNLDMFNLDGFNSNPDIMEKQYLCGQLEELTSEYLIGDMEGFNRILQHINNEKRWVSDDKGLLTKEVVQHLNVIWGAEFEENNVKGLLQEMKQFFSEKQMRQEPRGDIIPRICRYVEENYMEDVSIEKMGEILCITPTYLSRIFREKTGEKYINYVTGKRMEKAVEMLKLERYSIRQISEKVGYSSEKHFSRLFKKYFGVPPSHY